MDASDTTNRRKNRTLFTNRVVQQTTFDKGLKNHIILEDGVHTGAGAMTYAPNYYNARDGAVQTGAEERDALVASIPNKYPNPPTHVSATLVDNNVIVSFTAPTYQGISPITSYTVISNPGGVRVTGVSSPITITGLAPGFTYTFTVIATNASGNSDPSAPSNEVDTASVPDAPTAVSGVRGNATVNVSFTPPVFNGGLPIIDYTVLAYSGVTLITSAVGSASPILVTGLTNGTVYTFTVKARNSLGYSVESASSAAVTPATVPNAPTSVSAAAGNTQATISFTPPVSNGGSAILDYTFTAYVGVTSIGTITGSGSPTTWTGLTNGTTYTFTVKARNAVGYSAESAASAPVTPVNPATVPGIPTNFAVGPSAASMKLYFTAPSNGGSAITNYMYSTDDGVSFVSAGSTTSPITVSGLVVGTSYNFKLKAVNAVGAGDPTSAIAAAALAAFDPNDIAGINVWLDTQVPASITTSGGRVTAVADQSSAGNNFTASVGGVITYDFPSGINGRPGINFTTSYPAASTYLNRNANLTPTEQMTVFLVVRQTGVGSGNSELFFTRNSFQHLDIFNRTNSDGILYACVKGSPPTLNSGVDIITSPPTNALISFVTDATASMYVNGATTAINNSTRGTTFSLNGVWEWSISGAAFLGNYGEVMCFSKPLNTTQRQSVEGYLAWKWGMQSSLPGEHPYISAPPALALPAAPTSLVATPGNNSASIAFTSGSNGGTAITNYMYSTDNGVTFTAFSPAQTSSPLSITGLTNGTTYNVKLKAVTEFGVGAASAAVAVTPARVVSGSPRVLILGNPNTDPNKIIETGLQQAKTNMGYTGTMTILTVDIIRTGYTGSDPDPDITTSNYDVVILYLSQGLPTGYTTTLGDKLDSYVASGGKLIMCVFTWGNVRAFTGLNYTDSSTYVHSFASNQSSAFPITTLVSHPILSGIDGTISIKTRYTPAISIIPGSTTIASYSDTTSFIAIREPGSNGAKLVGLNLYPEVTFGGSTEFAESNKNVLRYLLNSIYWCNGSLI